MAQKATKFQREERQKEVTDKFRENYDKIFKKKCCGNCKGSKEGCKR